MAGLPLTQEDPALGKQHVRAVPCRGARFTRNFGNERPIGANMMRDGPGGQCLNHDIDRRTDRLVKAFDPRGNHEIGRMGCLTTSSEIKGRSAQQRSI